jgi:hypothetical protein
VTEWPWLTANRSHTASIHILDDDSLAFLTSFISIDLPSLTDMTVMSALLEGRDGTVENGGINSHTFAKDGHVVLARSPPLPLVIDYDGEDDDFGAEDEEGIL